MNILAISGLNEEFRYLSRLAEVAQNAKVEAVVFTGNILRAEARRQEWERAREAHCLPDPNQPDVVREHADDAQSMERFFKMLSALGVPAFIVPGKHDAPERFFLQAAFNTEIVAPNVYMVHRSFAPLGSQYVVAGFGGEITGGQRENEFFLMYPWWEAEFSLDFLRHLKQEKLLVFHTPPGEKLEGEPSPGGHELVGHLIKTYRPHFAVCARQDGRQGKLVVGNTLVVYPGRLSQGDYTLLDTKERAVSYGNLR